MADVVTYGEQVWLAGSLWLVVDVRAIDDEATVWQRRARLQPIDPDTGDRVNRIRIGRAIRGDVSIDIDRRASTGELRTVPRIWYGPGFTDAQTRLLISAATAIRWDLPPMTADERLAHLVKRVETTPDYAIANILGNNFTRDVRAHLRYLPESTQVRHREQLADALERTLKSALTRILNALG